MMAVSPPLGICAESLRAAISNSQPQLNLHAPDSRVLIHVPPRESPLGRDHAALARSTLGNDPTNPVQLKLRNALRRCIARAIEVTATIAWATTATIAVALVIDRGRPIRALAFGASSVVAVAGVAATLLFTLLIWNNDGTGPFRRAASVCGVGAVSAFALYSVGVTLFELRHAVAMWPMALLSGALSDVHELGTTRNPSVWRNVDPQPVGTTELDGLREFLRERGENKKGRGKYRFRAEVIAAHRIFPDPKMDARFEEFRSRLRRDGHPSDARKLFHGTSLPNARNIVAGGFRIGHGGMYGGGLYFAENPLKSLQYSGTKGGVRVVLLCDVLLGNSRVLKSAKDDLDPRGDLFAKKRHLFRWGVFFYRELVPRVYDSVTAAPSKLLPFISVYVPEFVVYRKEQVIPRYILIVKKHNY